MVNRRRSERRNRARTSYYGALVRHSTAIVVLLVGGAATDARTATIPQAPTVGSFGTTTVAELLNEESHLHDVAPAVSALAERAVEIATQAGRGAPAHPRDRESALRALKAINSALAALNFLQPPREDLWVHTLGE